MKIFDNKDINPDNRKENIEKNDKNNIDLLIADIYSHIIGIIYIC